MEQNDVLGLPSKRRSRMEQSGKGLDYGMEPEMVLFRNRVFFATVLNRDLNNHAINYSETVPNRDLKEVSYCLTLSLIENEL
jgi:hypothetical protein